jgi:phosphate transport system substrate-binding protein
MINSAGKTVAPTADSFQAAAANADWVGTPGFRVILTDEPGAGSWPISGATFILVYKKPDDPAATAEALKFFSWAYDHGSAMAEELDYVPMPESVMKAVRKAWADNIKDASGKAITLK